MYAQDLKNRNKGNGLGRANQLTSAREEYAFLAAAKRGDSAAF